jgi:NitT/TauT family transport system permease protein
VSKTADIAADNTVDTPVAPPLVNEPAESKWKWRLGALGLALALLGIWEAIPRLGLMSEIILPPVSDVIVAIGELVRAPTFLEHFGVTLTEIMVGFVIGTVIGLVGGISLGLSKALSRLVYPLVVAFQSIPKIVLAPLFITWFGYGIESKIAMAVVIAFFPVLINTLVGLESVPENPRRLMRSLRATRWQVFWKLSLPHSAPVIFAGIKTALTFAVIGAIVGEFIGASQGLGYLLHTYSFQLRIDAVFAVIVVLSALGSVLYFAIDWLDGRLIFWRADDNR